MTNSKIELSPQATILLNDINVFMADEDTDFKSYQQCSIDPVAWDYSMNTVCSAIEDLELAGFFRVTENIVLSSGVPQITISLPNENDRLVVSILPNGVRFEKEWDEIIEPGTTVQKRAYNISA